MPAGNRVPATVGIGGVGVTRCISIKPPVSRAVFVTFTVTRRVNRRAPSPLRQAHVWAQLAGED